MRRFRSALAVLLLATSTALGATARRGMVAAEHELAARAGADMLAHGGNAVDAAVAAAFATGVVNPSSSGIGGGGFLLVRDGKTRTLHVLDFRETAPRRARRDLFVRGGEVDPRLSLRGGLAVAVPGEVRGLAEALRRFGNLPLERVMAPAIRYAAEGFAVGEHLAATLRDNAAEIATHPAMAAIYLKPDGTPFAAGERLTNPDLAATLGRIATEGPNALYRGPIARSIVDAVSGAGGILGIEDLASYRVRQRDPLRATYRGYTVVAVPPPSSGGGVVLQILETLEGFDLRAGGPTAPATLALVAGAQKLAFADRARYYGDPDFTAVPIRRLLSRDYIARLQRQLGAASAPDAAEPATRERGGTSHMSAMDDKGYAAALTTTINTAFGSMVVAPGTGIILNNEMDDFAAAPGTPNAYGLVGAEANSIQPGKRPLSSMSPTLLLRDGAPFLAVGASGGPRIISATLLTILNVVDFGMGLDAAVAAPRVHHQWVPDALFVEPGLDAQAAAGLRALGHPVETAPGMGAVQAVLRAPDGFVGTADPRKGGAAVGW